VDSRYRDEKWHHFLLKKKCFGHYDQPKVKSLSKQSASGVTQLILLAFQLDHPMT